jgi:Cys-rich repeat protein
MVVAGCGGSSVTALVADNDASTPSDPDAQPEAAAVEAAPPAGCRTSLDCPAGQVCDPALKACFACVGDADCDSGKKCQGHQCIAPVAPCKNSLDCTSSSVGKVCDATSGKCVACVASTDCPSNNDCLANVCKPYTPCNNSLDCPTGQICNTTAGRCVECVGANDCAANQTCANNTCRAKCSSDNDCTKMGLLCDLGKGYCVKCVGATDCKPEEYCLEGACTPDVCAAGSSTCQANAVVTCRADGSGYGGPATCTAQQTCVASQGMASCKDRLCTPSVVACDTQSEKIIQCSADGLSFTTETDCAASSQVCVAAACVPVVCEAGKQYCKDGAVRKCSAKGDMTAVVQTCTASQFCDAVSATCKPLLCTPNGPACNGKIATTCNADGSGYVVGGIDCGIKNCSGGQCVDCDAATEVAYNGHCYYLDGSNGICDAGYAMVSESILSTIASSFVGKTYKHAKCSNCCVRNADPKEDWGEPSGHCCGAGPFIAGDPAPGGSGCTNVALMNVGQLTLCGSL